MIEKFKFKKGIVGFKMSQVYGNILEIYDDKVSVEKLKIANEFLDDDTIITVEDNINELFEFNNGLENDLDGFKEVFEVC
jgi:tryptophanyl-tRNA synthetase